MATPSYRELLDDVFCESDHHLCTDFDENVAWNEDSQGGIKSASQQVHPLQQKPSIRHDQVSEIDACTESRLRQLIGSFVTPHILTDKGCESSMASVGQPSVQEEVLTATTLKSVSSAASDWLSSVSLDLNPLEGYSLSDGEQWLSSYDIIETERGDAESNADHDEFPFSMMKRRQDTRLELLSVRNDLQELGRHHRGLQNLTSLVVSDVTADGHIESPQEPSLLRQRRRSIS